MSTTSAEATAQLIHELNKASEEDAIAWLRKAINGREWRLPLHHDETPDIGVSRLKLNLNGDARDALRSGAIRMLSEWIHSEPWPESAEWTEEKVDVLLGIVSDFASATAPERSSLAAFDLLFKLLHQVERFDLLPRYIQIRVQNVLEERSELFPVQSWRDLVIRDSARFGATAFGALTRLSLHNGLSVLPDLPAHPQILTALEFRVRWLLSLFPATERAAALKEISQTLQQVTPEVRDTLRAEFAKCGAPLPEAPSPRFLGVLAILGKQAAPRGALNPLYLHEALTA